MFGNDLGNDDGNMPAIHIPLISQLYIPLILLTLSNFRTGILVESGGLQTLHRAQQEIVGLHIAMHDLHHVVEISDRQAMVMLAGDEPI